MKSFDEEREEKFVDAEVRMGVTGIKNNLVAGLSPQ